MTMLTVLVKAFLLLQAHFERISLPITDYITDTISVLDQSIRVLQAYIDITAEQGCLSTTLMLIKTMVSIKQAIWDDANPLMILPGMKSAQAGKPGPTLRELPQKSKKELANLARQFAIGRESVEKFYKVSSSLPIMHIHTEQVSTTSLHINLHRQGHSYGPEFRAYTPFFPKAQTEGWFVFLCDKNNDEILALKRASFTSHARTVTKLGVPEECMGTEVELLIVSDVYPGIQYTSKIQLQGEGVLKAEAKSSENPTAMVIDSGAAKIVPRESQQQME